MKYPGQCLACSKWPAVLANYSLTAHPLLQKILPFEHGGVFQVNENLTQLPFDLISKCVKSVNATRQHAADEVVKIIPGNQDLSGFIYPHVRSFKNTLVFVTI